MLVPLRSYRRGDACEVSWAHRRSMIAMDYRRSPRGPMREAESLWLACRRPTFTSDQIVANAQTAGRRIVENMRKLVE